MTDMSSLILVNIIILCQAGDASKTGLYSSARSERGNRYVVTPRGSYLDYGIGNDSITGEPWREL